MKSAEQVLEFIGRGVLAYERFAVLALLESMRDDEHLMAWYRESRESVSTGGCTERHWFLTEYVLIRLESTPISISIDRYPLAAVTRVHREIDIIHDLNYVPVLGKVAIYLIDGNRLDLIRPIDWYESQTRFEDLTGRINP